MTSKAHDFPQIYIDLGYDLTKLGCIMLGLEVEQLVKAVNDVVIQDDLYYATNPDRFWINGNVAEKAHVTLLYGLVRSGKEFKKHVDALLGLGDGDTVPAFSLPQSVEVEEVNFFDSPYADDEYFCLIGHLKLTDALKEAHDRLTFLPHIETFPGYKPHVTLAYIRKDEKVRDDYIVALNKKLAGLPIPTGQIDYGGNK